jgi:hypothetical protein
MGGETGKKRDGGKEVLPDKRSSPVTAYSTDGELKYIRQVMTQPAEITLNGQ